MKAKLSDGRPKRFSRTSRPVPRTCQLPSESGLSLARPVPRMPPPSYLEIDRRRRALTGASVEPGPRCDGGGRAGSCTFDTSWSSRTGAGGAATPPRAAVTSYLENKFWRGCATRVRRSHNRASCVLPSAATAAVYYSACAIATAAARRLASSRIRHNSCPIRPGPCLHVRRSRS
jgi:hypothetical protein